MIKQEHMSSDRALEWDLSECGYKRNEQKKVWEPRTNTFQFRLKNSGSVIDMETEEKIQFMQVAASRQK